MVGPKSVMMVGRPDSGKSNYLARFWAAVDLREGDLFATVQPDNILYVETLLNHLNQGRFVPRSEHGVEDASHDVTIAVSSVQNPALSAEIVIPDIHGEVWKKAVSLWELPRVWLERLREANGALLFVRAHSDENYAPLNLVTSGDLLKAIGNDEKMEMEVPTQVAMAELLRFMEENLNCEDGIRPRVAIIVTAWDMLNEDERKAGPKAYLQKEYPLFAGRLKDQLNVDVRVYGVSILGTDVIKVGVRESIQQGGIKGLGYAVDGRDNEQLDVTAPVRWLLSD